MVFSESELTQNFNFWSEWFPREEAIELANRGGADTVFYTYKTDRRQPAGTQITGQDLRDQQRRFVENVRNTDGRFRTAKLRTERRRGDDGVIRTVRVTNVTEGMKRVALRRRDALVKLKVASPLSFRSWFMTHLPSTP